MLYFWTITIDVAHWVGTYNGLYEVESGSGMDDIFGHAMTDARKRLQAEAAADGDTLGDDDAIVAHFNAWPNALQAA